MSKRNHRATGPRTAAGKAVSSQNARTHGLTAATLQLDEHDRERFQNLRRELTTEVAPQGAIEQIQFERLVRSAWNIERIAQLEDNLFALDDPTEALRQLNLLARYRTTNERSFDRALKQLTQLQTNRALRVDTAGEIREKIPALTDITRFAKRTQIRQGLRDSQSDAADIDRELALIAAEIQLAQSQTETMSN